MKLDRKDFERNWSRYFIKYFDEEGNATEEVISLSRWVLFRKDNNEYSMVPGEVQGLYSWYLRVDDDGTCYALKVGGWKFLGTLHKRPA